MIRFSPKSYLMKILPLVFVLLLLSLAGYSQEATPYTPDFTLSIADVEAKALKDKEEVWVLDFWASWCGPCIQAVPHLKELQEKYADKNVRFISLSWDKDQDRWMKALYRLQMPWQHLRVEKGQDAFFNRYFKHSSIPTAFVIQKSGKVKRVSNVDGLEAAIIKAIR